MNVGRFKQAFRSPARPTTFRVQLNFPIAGDNSANDEFYCKGAQIPSRPIGLIEMSYQGRKVKFQGDSTFDAWNVTIYNDIDFTIRRKLERWIERVNTAKGNISYTNWQDVQANLKVFQLDGVGNVLKTYTMINAWPMSTGDPIDLDWGNNDTVEEYAVSFEYDYWESDTSTGGGLDANIGV